MYAIAVKPLVRCFFYQEGEMRTYSVTRRRSRFWAQLCRRWTSRRGRQSPPLLASSSSSIRSCQLGTGGIWPGVCRLDRLRMDDLEGKTKGKAD